MAAIFNSMQGYRT